MEDNLTNPEPVVRGEMEARQRHQANRSAWNEGASRYAEWLNGTIDFIRTGKSNLHPVERAMLGDLRPWCKTAVQLQCASGRDTLSLWNEGVKHVVGVDISDVHIENARKLSQAVGAPADWYCCDVLDTPEALNGTADLVYTGRGALPWLHDLDAWAAVIFRLLKPGGILSLFEEHPTTWLWDMEAETLVFSGISYFGYAESSRGWGDNYLGDIGIPVEKQSIKHERLWTLAEVFMALRGAGLDIERFGEHAEPYYDEFPNLKEDYQRLIPHTYSMIARKPDHR